MPSPKLLVNPDGLEAQFRLIPDNDEKEEGQLDDDDDDDDYDEEKDDAVVNNAETEQGNNQVDGSPASKTENDGSSKEQPRLSIPPKWCRVIRCMRAPNVGVFLLDNVDLDWIEDKGSKFTHGFRFETAPDWIEKLTTVPLSRRLEQETNVQTFYQPPRRFELDLNRKPTIPRTSLLLSPLQMITECYPMPYDEEIRVLRSKYYPVDDRSPIFAVDCEMCMTDTSELTKISIVDENLRVVYNELVKPDNPITNYLTRYSGITKEMLEDVTTTLEDVQHFMRKNLPRDAILCGHSLNGDLAAIKICHPYVIDTSVIYNRTGRRSLKPSLKHLAYEFLGKEIQTMDKLGHDSLEDAITSMELVNLKLIKGITFGDCVAYEESQGVKYDHKTGITHLQIDKFIERHKVTPISYRYVDTTPGSRCFYVHDKQEPLDQGVKDAVLELLDRKEAICVILTNTGECYVKF